MSKLPSDPFMLLSVVNMKLRDEYPSLEDLCLGLDIDSESLTKKLKDAGFQYDSSTNQFK